MYKLLYYTFDDLNIVDYEYVVSHNIQDIIEYEYLQKFCKYLPQYLLTSEDKCFCKSYEDLWWDNKIDETNYYSFNPDFIDFIKNKYYNNAYEECINNIELEKLDKQQAVKEFDPNTWLLDDNSFELKMLVAEEYN